MNMRPGFFTRQGCQKQNRKRLYFAEYQTNESRKKWRKIIQGKKKGKGYKWAATEGVTYKAGRFWTEGYISMKMTVHCNYG